MDCEGGKVSEASRSADLLRSRAGVQVNHERSLGHNGGIDRLTLALPLILRDWQLG
jgi:hypothetical protein